MQFSVTKSVLEACLELAALALTEVSPGLEMVSGLLQGFLKGVMTRKQELLGKMEFIKQNLIFPYEIKILLDWNLSAFDHCVQTQSESLLSCGEA